MKKIYTSSRAKILQRVEMWHGLRAQGMVVTASWIDEHDENTNDLTAIWNRLVDEVKASDALLMYAEMADFPLRGVLVEVGIALGAGVPVHVVVPDGELEGRSLRPLGAWAKHRQVTLHKSMDAALEALGYGHLKI